MSHNELSCPEDYGQKSKKQPKVPAKDLTEQTELVGLLGQGDHNAAE